MRRPATGAVVALLFVSLSPIATRAQERDTTGVRFLDVQADSGRVRMVNGRELFELLRPVLRDGDTTIRSQRMVQPADSMFLFTDDVRVVDGSDTLDADRVLYDQAARVGRASGNVRLSDGDVLVLAPEGDYDTEAKRADFRAGVRLVDSTSTLTSRTGSYWTRSKEAEFAGDVLLEQDSLRMAADSLRYERETRIANAWSRVVIERDATHGDTLDVTWVTGARAVNDEEGGRSTVSGDVLVLRATADSVGAVADSLWIAARTVDFLRSDSLDEVIAVDSVRIVQGSFAAIADSVAYRVLRRPGAPERRESRFFGSPLTWIDNAQVSGDTLAVVGRGGSADSLVVDGRAYVALRDSVTAPLQQLRGRRMIGLFREDSLRVLEVHSNAEALYYMGATSEREGGAVKTSGDRVVLHLDGNEVTGIRIYAGVEGTWYPASLLDDTVRLDGTPWQPERRPDADSLRSRYLQATCRLAPDGCPARDGSP